VSRRSKRSARRAIATSRNECEGWSDISDRRVLCTKNVIDVDGSCGPLAGLTTMVLAARGAEVVRGSSGGSVRGVLHGAVVFRP